jgi:hypothetical protein
MSQLGDVFELVVTGPPNAAPFFAECRRSFPRGGERCYQIWCADADKVREEGLDEGGKPVSTYVQAGSRWWHWHEARGATTNTLGDAKERANSEIAWMLLAHGRIAVDPAAQIESPERVADRDAILIRTPERMIAVDAEHGLTLRSVYRGNVIFEVDKVEFGVRMPSERFEFSPPPGAKLRAASSDRPVPRPAAEVAARVDFRVFEPGAITLDWPVDAQPWLDRRDRPDAVTIRLRGAPIWIHQTPTPDPASFGSRFAASEEWSRVVRNGVELDVRDAPAVVRLVRDGTHIELYGEAASLEELVTIALALRPVGASTSSES